MKFNSPKALILILFSSFSFAGDLGSRLPSLPAEFSQNLHAKDYFSKIALTDASSSWVFSLNFFINFPVVVYFFDPSCRPNCRQDLILLDEMLQRFAIQKLKIVAISTNPLSATQLRNISKAEGLDFPLALSKLNSKQWLDLFSASTLPLTLFVDQKGKITNIKTGNWDKQSLTDFLTSMLINQGK